MGGCWHALSLLGIPPGPDSLIKMIMFENAAAPRAILAEKAAAFPGHLVLSNWRDRAGDVGSVLALVEDDCRLMVSILRENPSAEHVLITGGSPCQGLSRARSNAKGVYDPRSALIWVFHALAHKAIEFSAGSRSVALVIENVVMHSDCVVPDNISKLFGAKPQRPNANLWTHCDRDRYYWSSYRAHPLPTPGQRPDCSSILREGWRPLWELIGDKASSHFSVFLRPFLPQLPSEHVTSFWKYPLHRYDERGLVYRPDSPEDILVKIRGFIYSAMRGLPTSRLRDPRSEINKARSQLCAWIHLEGGSSWLRPLDADERDQALGYPRGASGLPSDFHTSPEGLEFDRCGLTGNAWAPPAAAHVLAPLRDHVLHGAPLEVSLKVPVFSSKEDTLRLIQPSKEFLGVGGRGRR